MSGKFAKATLISGSNKSDAELLDVYHRHYLRQARLMLARWMVEHRVRSNNNNLFWCTTEEWEKADKMVSIADTRPALRAAIAATRRKVVRKGQRGDEHTSPPSH